MQVAIIHLPLSTFRRCRPKEEVLGAWFDLACGAGPILLYIASRLCSYALDLPVVSVINGRLVSTPYEV